MQGSVWQRHGGDALSALAARDAQPVAEGRAGGPVATKNAKRIRELCSEREQSVEVSASAIAPGRNGSRRQHGGQSHEGKELEGHVAGVVRDIYLELMERLAVLVHRRW